VPAKQRDQPHVTLSDRDRWAHVELLLHDDTIRLYVRVAGLFTLLFAQPLSRTCRMRADQITITKDGGVTVSFDTFPIELPKPLDRLLVRHLATRGQASYASRPDRWLFPGGRPGKHRSARRCSRRPLIASVGPLLRLPRTRPQASARPGQPVRTQGAGDHHVALPPRPPTLAPALHAYVEFLDQPHRALVQRAHRPAGHPLERRPQTIHLEGHRRRDHREGPTRTSRPHPPDQFNDGPLPADHTRGGGLARPAGIRSCW